MIKYMYMYMCMRVSVQYAYDKNDGNTLKNVLTVI